MLDKDESDMRFSESVLITGQNTRIVVRYPREVSDEVIEDMLKYMELGENWSVSDYTETTAFQRDEQLFVIRMSAVTGVGR